MSWSREVKKTQRMLTSESQSFHGQNSGENSQVILSHIIICISVSVRLLWAMEFIIRPLKLSKLYLDILW